MDEIYKHTFRVCAIWEAQAFSLMNYCGFNIEPFCSDVCGNHRRPQTLAEICRDMGVCCGFRAVATREKYPGFILSVRNVYFQIWLTMVPYYLCAPMSDDIIRNDRRSRNLAACGLTHLPLLPHNAIYAIGTALVQIMACRLFGTKPSSNRCWFIVNWTIRNKFQWNFNQNTQHFSFTKTVHPKTSSAKWRSFCPAGDEFKWYIIHCCFSYLHTLSHRHKTPAIRTMVHTVSHK